MRSCDCGKLLFESDEKKFSFRRVEGQKKMCSRAFSRRYAMLESNSYGRKG